jgi:hypothetical protein
MKASIGKIWRLAWPERLLLAEAVVFLAFAALAVALFPFRQVGAVASRSTHERSLPEQALAATVNRVRWAIEAASRRVPWRALCFEQGLTAQHMLRRRGVPSVLYYGAARDSGTDLSAHVWVRAGDVDVVGCEIASRFALLATFPAQTGEEWRSSTS